jgi:ABC-type polysaccharide/polyol phosphate export permease
MAVSAASFDNLFILRNLVGTDFKVRYRNMSLGIFWSLIQPLIMMGVLTYVFTVLFPSPVKRFPLFVLVGLIPFNFFSLAWAASTRSIVDNAHLIKKVPFRRELVPLAVVLGNAVHYFIQLGILLAVAAYFSGVTIFWLWLPVIVFLQLVLATGASLFTAALDVYYRDVRYVVESINMVLFWLVPIFYSFEQVQKSLSPKYLFIYELNPVAAMVLVTRRVLLNGESPGPTLLKFAAISLASLLIGHFVFRRLQRNFSDYM